eukprot:s3121_g15.t1
MVARCCRHGEVCTLSELQIARDLDPDGVPRPAVYLRRVVWWVSSTCRHADPPEQEVKFDSVNYANVNTNGYALWEVIEAPAPGPGEVEVQCCERHRFTVPGASLIQLSWFHLVFMCQWMQSDLLAMRKSP